MCRLPTLQANVVRSPRAGLLSPSSRLYLGTRVPLPGLPCLPHLPSAPSPLPHLNRHRSRFQPVSFILRGPSLLSNARQPAWGPQCCRVIHKLLRGHTPSRWPSLFRGSLSLSGLLGGRPGQVSCRAGPLIPLTPSSPRPSSLSRGFFKQGCPSKECFWLRAH